MTPRDLTTETIVARLRLMRELLQDLDALGEVTPQRLEDDRLNRRALERILTQLVELAVDINQHVASAVNDEVASGYRTSFDAAARAKLFDAALADELKPSVGLRNVLTHEYVNVDLATVAAAVPRAREGYTKYIQRVATWISAQQG